MSVLIKGLKMPTNCYQCRFSRFTLKGGGGVCLVIDKECDGTFRRLKDCPIIELPDHGDLIDREELLKKKMKMDAFVALEWVSDVDICLARTVIPTERSKL